MIVSDNAEENNLAAVCVHFEKIRRESSAVYKTIKALIQFAVKKENPDKSAIVLSELMSRSNQHVVIHSDDVKYLMVHHEDIFRDATIYDDNSETRCLPTFTREKMRVENRYGKEIRKE